MTVDHLSSYKIFASLLADLAVLREPLLPGEEHHPVSMLTTGAGFALFPCTLASGSPDGIHDIGLLMEHSDFGTPEHLLECLTDNEFADGDVPLSLQDETRRWQLKKMMEVHDRVAPTRLEAAVSFALPHAPRAALDAFLRDYRDARRIFDGKAALECLRAYTYRCEELVDIVCSADEGAALGI